MKAFAAKHRRRLTPLFHQVLFPLLVGGLLQADIVFLENGGQFEGKVREFEDKVEVTTSSGATLSIPRSQVKEIRRKKLPAEELKERKASFKGNDPEAAFELALWCKENSLKEEYEKYLKETLRLDPDHPEAKKTLYTFQRTYKKLPANSKAVEKLRAEFGPEFTIVHTQHFRICTNADTDFANFRADLFEAVYRTFYGFFEERKFPLTTLDEHLEVVLFDTREQFNQYARKRSPSLESAAGFYSMLENRVTFFNALNDANYQKTKRLILQVEGQVEALRKQLAQTRATQVTLTFQDGSSKTYSKSGAMSALAREERKIADERRKLTAFYRNENVTTTVHECLHQLAFNLGVQKITGDNPKWVAEGMATYFETATDGFLSQVGRINSDRLKLYRAAREAGRLIPLATLVSQDALFVLNSQTASLAYAQGWGLVHFLMARYPKPFLEYLKKLGEENAGQPLAPEVRLQQFQEYMGHDLPALQKEWLTYLDSLRP